MPLAKVLKWGPDPLCGPLGVRPIEVSSLGTLVLRVWPAEPKDLRAGRPFVAGSYAWAVFDRRTYIKIGPTGVSPTADAAKYAVEFRARAVLGALDP